MKFQVIAALIVFVIAACSPLAPATPEPAPAVVEHAAPAATPGVSVSFMAPSGNIACIYTPTGGTEVYQTADGRAELQCDRNEPEYLRVVLPEQGAARIVETDERGCCSGETIGYGDRWVEGPFTCDVTEAGVACTSAAGHGFTLSRSRADVN